jgi:hypothetical protein
VLLCATSGTLCCLPRRARTGVLPCMEGDSRAVTAALHGCRSEVGVAPAPPRARCSSDAVADWRPSRRSLCRGCSSSISERRRAMRRALLRR